MTEPHDEILEALARLAEEGAAPTSPGFEAGARAALHRAVDRRNAGSGWSFRASLLHRRATRGFGAAIAGAAAVVVALGWSAPAGSPLHAVRLAREAVILGLPGSDRAGRELQFAEDRLADAAAGRDRSASLSEAASLLDSAAQDLRGHSGAAWDRWSRDEAELRQAGEGSPSGGSGDPTSGSGGRTTPGGSGTSGGGSSPGGSGTSGGGSDQGGSSAGSSGTSGGSGGSGGGSGPSGSGSSSSSSSSSSSRTSSDGGGSSSDAGGSSSSSDGGGSSGSGGEPSTATTTSTSTTGSSSGH